jgi:hypothetical protein
MPIRVDAYITEGMVSGVFAETAHLRDVLEEGRPLILARASFRAIGQPAERQIGDVSIPIDDVLIAVAEDDPIVPVHASWHPISLHVGPFRVDGELPTLPGFDPGRALTRPSGEFVMLRDVRLAMRDAPSPGTVIGRHALVNRYGVERVAADLMLGFFFPGAAMEGVEAATA